MHVFTYVGTTHRWDFIIHHHLDILPTFSYLTPPTHTPDCPNHTIFTRSGITDALIVSACHMCLRPQEHSFHLFFPSHAIRLWSRTHEHGLWLVFMICAYRVVYSLPSFVFVIPFICCPLYTEFTYHHTLPNCPHLPAPTPPPSITPRHLHTPSASPIPKSKSVPIHQNTELQTKIQYSRSSPVYTISSTYNFPCFPHYSPLWLIHWQRFARTHTSVSVVSWRTRQAPVAFPLFFQPLFRFFLLVFFFSF